MTARTPSPAGTGIPVTGGQGPAFRPVPPSVSGGEPLALALALATSLRARGPCGLDVLRRSRDRAPPRSP